MLIPWYFDIYYLHFKVSKVFTTSINHDIIMVPYLKPHGNTMVPLLVYGGFSEDVWQGC